MNSHLSEKEQTIAAKELNVQVIFLTGENKRMIAQCLALASENEEMRRQLLTLEKRREELAHLITQKEEEYVARRSELEEFWLKERGDIQRANEEKVVAIQDDLQTMEAICASKDNQIQALAQDKEELQTIRLQYEYRELAKQASEEWVATDGDFSEWSSFIPGIDKKELQDICGRQEQKIWELNDKLSECHRRLSASSACGTYPTLLSPIPQSRSPEPARHNTMATV